MPHQKSCSGLSAILTWGLADPSCVYGLKLTIDGQDVTTSVNEDNTQSAAQIEADLMAARIAPFTNVNISVSIVGNSLNVTISNVTLPAASPGAFDITINNPGGICINQSALGSFLVCSVIPDPKKKTRRFGAIAMQQCPDEIIFRADVQHPQVSFCNQIYNFYEKDADGLLHYVNATSNLSQRGRIGWTRAILK